MKLKLGLPKGSLQEPTFALFHRAGYNFRTSSRSYQPLVDDDTLEPILLRPQEIPNYIADGVIDAGLTGKDWIMENDANVVEVCELRYSKNTSNPMRIVFAVHQDSPIRTVSDLAGCRIATEYVNLCRRHLESKGVQPKDIEFSWGADEVKVPTLVDAILVNTETGNSLRAHNLRIVETILESTTRFVASPSAWVDPWKRERIESLQILLEGAMNAAKLVGLKMNLPRAQQAQILGLLPSLKNPTLSPLSDADWVAAEVILSETEVRELIPQLKRAGATGLVEYPLNKVIY